MYCTIILGDRSDYSLDSVSTTVLDQWDYVRLITFVLSKITNYRRSAQQQRSSTVPLFDSLRNRVDDYNRPKRLRNANDQTESSRVILS